MKTWIKYGLIADVILLLLMLVVMLIPGSGLENFIFSVFIYLPIYPIARAGIDPGNFVYFGILLIEYFVIGALIGLLIAKYRKKEN